MSDDHAKRFNLSEKRPGKPFSLTASAIRDKDNAQPQPPRPRFVSLDHPRLAPPGMAGTRSGAFKPLVAKSPIKDRGPER